MLVTWSACRKGFDKRLVISNAGNMEHLQKKFDKRLVISNACNMECLQKKF